MSTRSEFRFFERLRVRWAEVDLQKIVFNGHYLMYFDTAVAGWWRALALPYHPTMAALDGDFFVRKASLEYNASARYDDLIDVGVRTARIGNSSKVLDCAVFRGDELLVRGELVYVFANPATQTSPPSRPASRWSTCGGAPGTCWAARPARSASRCSSTSRRSRPSWNGTLRMPCACMPWPTTGWACRWPPGGCSSTSRVSRRSAAWRCWRRCAAVGWAALCWMR